MNFAEHYRQAIEDERTTPYRRTSSSGGDLAVARMLERLLDSNRQLARENSSLTSELATAYERIVHMRNRIIFLHHIFEHNADRTVLTLTSPGHRVADPRVRAYANGPAERECCLEISTATEGA